MFCYGFRSPEPPPRSLTEGGRRHGIEHGDVVVATVGVFVLVCAEAGVPVTEVSPDEDILD
jgi:hypothetical protein